MAEYTGYMRLNLPKAVMGSFPFTKNVKGAKGPEDCPLLKKEKMIKLKKYMSYVNLNFSK
jgi:hypothetical protein